MHIGPDKIERVSQAKLLGVILDSKLTWKNHTAAITGKLYRAIAILYKMRYLVGRKWLIRLYYAFFHPHINYCCSIWGSAPKVALQPLIIAQHKAIKTMYNLEPRTPTSFIYQISKFLTVSEICDYQSLIFMYKFHHDLLPLSLNELFTAATTVVSRPTRNRIDYYIPTFRLSSTQRSILYRGPLLWNDLSPNLKTATSVKAFKDQLKNYYKSEK